MARMMASVHSALTSAPQKPAVALATASLKALLSGGCHFWLWMSRITRRASCKRARTGWCRGHRRGTWVGPAHATAAATRAGAAPAVVCAWGGGEERGGTCAHLGGQRKRKLAVKAPWPA
jgi:hypothetical protein